VGQLRESERILEQRVEERTRELDALLRADAELFRSLDLDEVLQALVDVAVDLLGADKSIVTIWDRERGEAQLRASRNISSESLQMFQSALTRPGHGSLPDDFDLVIHKDLPAPGTTLVGEQLVYDIARREGITVSVEIPVKSPTRGVLGGFGIGYTRAHEFSKDDERLFTALAERAAAAIENAELYKRAQQAASLEERQRLARELHDSVSQALYGIALGARTARALLDQDPAKATEPVDYVLSLAEAGLTEMRALIFELRPESLANEGVVAALEKQIASARARHGLDITFEPCPEPDVPLEVKEAVYRIGQEALHNIVKHAKANHVVVALKNAASGLELTITDDGVGFDPDADYAGHLGLRSMRERAASVHGDLTIESAPGSRTTVSLRVTP
jgi:signal transduction histidine kinase